MNQKSELKAVFEEALGKVGFKRRSGIWIRENEDTISLVELQSSQYGMQYFVNIGLWLKQMGKFEIPKVERCHIYTRWSTVSPDEADRLKELLDLERPLDSEKRRASLRFLIERDLVVLLANAGTISNLKSGPGARFLEGSLVVREARERLGLPPLP